MIETQRIIAHRDPRNTTVLREGGTLEKGGQDQEVGLLKGNIEDIDEQKMYVIFNFQTLFIFFLPQ